MPALRRYADRWLPEAFRQAHRRRHDLNGTFYDVRTALPADEVSNLEMLEQGSIASHVVASWFVDPPDDDSALADRIPFLPRRPDDYALRSAAVRH